jgi:hypothetical protein
VTDGNGARRSNTGGRWFFLAGLVLLSVLGWYFGFQDLGALLRGARKLPLGGMALLIIAGFWIRAVKWHFVLGPDQQGISLFFLAKTAGNWTPGRAGELAPLLLKRHRNARVAAWIGLDRLIEVAWTLGLGLAGALSLGLVSPLGGAGLGLVGASLSFFALYLTRRQGSIGLTRTETENPGWRARLSTMVLRVRLELLLFSRKLPGIMALTLVAKLTDIYAVVLLCQAFGYSAGLLLVCAARCAHGLVSAIPVTPDATGVPYVAAAWFLNQYAAIPFETLTAALALEAIVINAILWACFCLASAGPWKTRTIG